MEAQRRLGIRFPVHVLVTRCDRVPGFAATCRELPEAARDELFGWSSPYPTEAAFAPAWVDEAYEALDRSLYETQVELLSSAAPTHADGVFRFSGELRQTHASLRALLGEVFRESAYHEGFFFRGIYFTGDPAFTLPAEPSNATGGAMDPTLSMDGDDTAAAVETRTPATKRAWLACSMHGGCRRWPPSKT